MQSITSCIFSSTAKLACMHAGLTDSQFWEGAGPENGQAIMSHLKGKYPDR